MYASVLYELREADLHEIRRMDRTVLPTLNEKAVGDRMGQGDIDPDRIVVLGGDPAVDNRMGQGAIDPDRIGVTGVDPDFTCITGATEPQRTEVDGRKR